MARWFDKRLQEAKDLLESARTILEELKDEQEGKNENYPEGLQGTEAYEKMEARAEAFDESESSIAEIIDTLENLE